MTINRINVSWAPRRESAEDCTDRLHLLYVLLAEKFPRLANWYAKGQTKEEASSGPRLNELDAPSLLAFVRKAAQKRDDSNLTVASLGFTGGFWNGEENGVSVGVQFTIGLSATDTPGLRNNFVILLPTNLAAIGLESAEARQELLLTLVQVWEPDWGAVFSSKSTIFKNRVGFGPFLDEALWIKKAQSESPFDESVTVKKLESGVLYLR